MSDQLERLIREGCTAAEAVDYLAVEARGWTQTAWAEERGVSQQTVSGNVAGARRQLSNSE